MQVKVYRACGSPACKFGYFENVTAGSSRHLNISTVWTTDIICVKMIWGFLPPGVLVAPLRSWHAAPSRDETVLLASYQRPADWGHVSARLSVNNCSALPSLGLFTLSPSSASCLSHLALWPSIPLVSSTLQPNSFAFFSSHFLDCLRGFGCSLVLFLLNNLLNFLCLSRSRWDPAAEMTGPVDERRRASSVSWIRGSKCWPIIHHNTEGNNSN